MVSSISSSSLSYLTSITSSTGTSGSSSAEKAQLEAQIAAKETELEGAGTEDTTEIEQAIAALKAQLAALEAEALSSALLGGESETASFSGESAKIGTGNFDEDSPFGERTMWV